MAPPLTGVAVKVAEVPAQIVVIGTVILTAGVTGDETDMVIVPDVTVAGKGHVALDVIITVTRSPFASEVVVYDEEFVPTFMPFTFH